MLKTLYEHFTILYQNILPSDPSLAAEHALKQEEEVYKKSTKTTYRHVNLLFLQFSCVVLITFSKAVIQCIAILKRRPLPTSPNDPSVGTEEDISTRMEAQKQLEYLRLTRDTVQQLIHPLEELQKWGYFIDIPPGDGGTQPAALGKIVRCDRCPQYYLVKCLDEAEQCIYHWGRPYLTRIGGKYDFLKLYNIKSILAGEKVRMYSCCQRPVADGEGCSHGPHVFSEKEAGALHSRHPFSILQSPSHGKLDVAALDCEMIYTTGGIRVARVSVVDGMGKEILDQLVQMDEGVEVM